MWYLASSQAISKWLSSWVSKPRCFPFILWDSAYYWRQTCLGSGSFYIVDDGVLGGKIWEIHGQVI